MSTFTVENQIKTKLSYNSDVTCQPPGHSKCDKIYDTDTTNRRGKLLIFMPKALTFYTTDFSYMNICSSKIGLVSGQARALNEVGIYVFVDLSLLFW